MIEEESGKIIYFMTPGAGTLVLGRYHISNTGEMHYFVKNLLLYSRARFRQTKGIVMMTMEGCTLFVNLMTPGTVVFVLGRAHISNIWKMHYFFKILLIYRHIPEKLKV